MRLAASLIVALACVTADAALAADAARGAIVARVRCGQCHFLDRETPRIGPGLKGVYGRAPGIAGVPFERWDEASLAAWLSGPRRIKPNTEMVLPPLSARDRADVIAWLKSRAAREAAQPPR
ncbi:MAG: c-type cytochrome [Mariprofundaceae bacterium]